MLSTSSNSALPTRVLGRTGIPVSVLGLGGHTYDIGPNGFCTHEQRAELVADLVAGGMTYFDTTWMHEVELLADSFRRANLMDAYKQGDLHVSLQHVDGMSDDDWAAKLPNELERRLSILGASQAELFLMGTGNGIPSLGRMIDCIEAMARLRDQGLIKHVGVSCHTLEDFATLADAIERVDAVDYLMLRYNFKYRQIEERLLPLAASKNIGVVAMLVFCWDCGPGQWGRRISVFEPLDDAAPQFASETFTPAQQNIRWILENPQIATTVPAINAPWEASQNLAAARDRTTPVDTTCFTDFLDRMWSRSQLESLAHHAMSEPIRARAAQLLRESDLQP